MFSSQVEMGLDGTGLPGKKSVERFGIPKNCTYCAIIYKNLPRLPIGLGCVDIFRGAVYSFSLVIF